MLAHNFVRQDLRAARIAREHLRAPGARSAAQASRRSRRMPLSRLQFDCAGQCVRTVAGTRRRFPRAPESIQLPCAENTDCCTYFWVTAQAERPPIMAIPEYGQIAACTRRSTVPGVATSAHGENGLDPAHNDSCTTTHGFSGTEGDSPFPTSHRGAAVGLRIHDHLFLAAASRREDAAASGRQVAAVVTRARPPRASCMLTAIDPTPSYSTGRTSSRRRWIRVTVRPSHSARSFMQDPSTTPASMSAMVCPRAGPGRTRRPGAIFTPRPPSRAAAAVDAPWPATVSSEGLEQRGWRIDKNPGP